MRNQINRKKAFNMLEMSIILIVIGIITALVSSGSSLITNARMSSLRQATESSPVNTIKDLAFWVEASSQNSFADEDPVIDSSIALWKDINPQDTSKIDMVQASAPLQPTYKIDGDKLPYIDFDGSDALASSTQIPGSRLARPDEITAFVVQKYRGGSTTAFAKDGANARILLHATFSDENIYWDLGSAANGRISKAKPSDFDNRWNLITVTRKNSVTTNNSVIRINGGSNFHSGDVTQIFDIGVLSFFYIGAYNTSADQLDGGLREIIIFKRALRQVEIDAVEKYLSNKWKIDLKQT